MSDNEYDIDDIERRMNGAFEALRHEFVGLRTGRANAGMLEPVVVNAYGSDMPINQVATINVPEPRMITVQVWDKGNVQAVEKAIRSAGLGLNPAVDGQLIRVPIPELTQQRRQELTKVASQYAEHARVAVRNVRRDGMERLKKLMRDAHMSEDDHEMWSEETQRLTDETIKKIDDALAHKQKEIMQV